MSDGQLGLGLQVESAKVGDVERALVMAGERWAVGVDEVGRGPLAGPVTVACVAVDLTDFAWCAGVDDSKKLSEQEREGLAALIREHASAVCVTDLGAEEVDRLNPLGASLRGMRETAEAVLLELGEPNVTVLVDGKTLVPGASFRQRCFVKGDARSFAIAAASVVAKVHRDALMKAADALHPEYGFGQHKGYGTAQHLRALAEHGPCSLHRKSFRPVALALAGREGTP